MKKEGIEVGVGINGSLLEGSYCRENDVCKGVKRHCQQRKQRIVTGNGYRKLMGGLFVKL